MTFIKKRQRSWTAGRRLCHSRKLLGYNLRELCNDSIWCSIVGLYSPIHIFIWETFGVPLNKIDKVSLFISVVSPYDLKDDLNEKSQMNEIPEIITTEMVSANFCFPEDSFKNCKTEVDLGFIDIESKKEFNVKDVTCTLFTPTTIKKSNTLFIQVFTHLKENLEEVENLAKKFDKYSINKGQVNLNIKENDQLSFLLSIRNLEIDEPIQRIVWYGVTDSVVFEIDIPKELKSKYIIGKVIVILGNNIPIGHINFKVKIVESTKADEKSITTGLTKWYQQIFISYAREDTKKLVSKIEMLRVLRIRFFQDIYMRAGTRWESEIYKNIELSDAFILFWSSSAQKSKWVKKEIQYALEIKKGMDNIPPEILPVIIENPPPKPPKELEHLHFYNTSIIP